MDCQKIEASIREGFSLWTKVSSLGSGECLIRLPFWDGEGDPLELTATIKSGRATIDDAGSIAGLLFSLGQDEQSTPAFKLLDNLRRAYSFEIDFNEGVVRLSVPEGHLYDGIAEMAKVVIAMHTVTPHIRSRPRRRGSYGYRVKTKILSRYRELEILDRVERSHTLAGATVSDWPIDFRWTVGANGSTSAVNVVAADLRIAEPFAKADRIVALSVDTWKQHQLDGDQLRIAIESQDENDLSLEAAEFLRHHSGKLGYRIFDLQNKEESSEFYALSVKEITTRFPEPWSELAGVNWRHPN